MFNKNFPSSYDLSDTTQSRLSRSALDLSIAMGGIGDALEVWAEDGVEMTAWYTLAQEEIEEGEPAAPALAHAFTLSPMDMMRGFDNYIEPLDAYRMPVMTPPPFAVHTFLILALEYIGMVNYRLEYGDEGPEEWTLHVNMGAEPFNVDDFAGEVLSVARDYAAQLNVKFAADRIGVLVSFRTARFGDTAVVFSS